jgi:hypothetical protein
LTNIDLRFNNVEYLHPDAFEDVSLSDAEGCVDLEGWYLETQTGETLTCNSVSNDPLEANMMMVEHGGSEGALSYTILEACCVYVVFVRMVFERVVLVSEREYHNHS